MTGILAIETATDACSVAVHRQGETQALHELAPRRHNRLLFEQLDKLLPGGKLREQGIGCLAYGEGPGSFTGLRIAASAVQGLAYSTALPVVPVPTLATLAQTALREGATADHHAVLCVLDARIDEVYAAVYNYSDGLAVLREGPWACHPGDLAPGDGGELHAVGNGCAFLDDATLQLRDRIVSREAGLFPCASDMIPLALERFRRGDVQSAESVQPVYVRDEISWKKLSEQGRPA